MAWNSLNNRFDSLPEILAGPILRRVEKDSVSVWVVYQNLSSVATIKLEVYNSSGNIVLSSEDVLSHSGDYRFGNNLHVCLITAKASDIASQLVEGHTYKYNVLVKDDSVFLGLTDPGVLQNANYSLDISYDGSGLPSFSIPPSDLNKLNVVHGSCRKPHGGELDGRFDALYGLDKIISSAYLESSSSSTDFAFNRPHFLFLTGDQVYADDVADMLLYMIQDAVPVLMGHNENLDDVYTPPENPFLNFLLPGLRHNLRDQTGFTSTDDRSHLITLGEFYCMYLFAWSDVLWPKITSDVTNDLPTYEQVYSGSYSASINHGRDQFDTHKKLLISFYQTLKSVRRALANVPTYMIFDDHEVTDDWNLNLEWFNKVHGDAAPGNINAGKPLGRRIIQNAVSAYAVFQAWGNTPDRFLSFNNIGGELFTNLINLAGNTDYDTDKASTIQSILFPSLATDSAGNRYLTGGFDWGFYLQFLNQNNPDHSYQFIILNCRTNRKFGSGTQLNAFAGLINDNSLSTLMGSITPKDILTFFVSPGPVIGSYAIEHTKEVLNKGGAKTRVDLDMEDWIFNKGTFESFLNYINAFEHSIILSGDVHYAYSRSLHYWNHRTANEKVSQAVQFVSSALKNETTGMAGTRGAADSDSNPLAAGPRILSTSISRVRDTIGFETSQKIVTGIFYLIVRQSSAPHLHTQEYKGDVLGRPKIFDKSVPHWCYRISPIWDNRTNEERSINVSFTAPPGKPRLAEKHRLIKDWSKYRVVIGVNNISLIQIVWEPSSKIAIQKFYFIPTSQFNSLTRMDTYVKHKYDFGTIVDVKPGY